jgi:hypothetical protein
MLCFSESSQVFFFTKEHLTLIFAVGILIIKIIYMLSCGARYTEFFSIKLVYYMFPTWLQPFFDLVPDS